MQSPKFQLLSCLLLALATFALATGAKFPSDNDGTAKSTHVEGEPGCGWRYGLPFFHQSLPAPSTTVAIKASPTHNLEVNNAIPIRHSVHFTPITFGLPAQATAHAHAKRDDAAIPVLNVLEWNIQPKPTCTITFWQFPTPYQRGSASTVWTATTVVTDYFDCSGCAMEIQHIPKSRTHFTETTTISSLLSLITPACASAHVPTPLNQWAAGSIKSISEVEQDQASVLPRVPKTETVAFTTITPSTNTSSSAPSPTSPSTTTRGHQTYNCTTTFYVEPTPDLPGPTKWEFISTSTATVVFNCHGCRLFVKTVGGLPSQTFTTTVTSSSVLGIVTQACEKSTAAAS